ncbi:SGNH/GDSL hydrolase family protein [Luteolibacter luteus]|uniref:SGNH hydrolase-type esterase domain-containing protein n=1 Tax=Luteolibacter luteus TaxID=2728835 RepID=A0A858RIQ6_9BACT|nr:SGNH/GDSL hydrolase family protein [Luteolibacter luteus]QJE95933.1 hypothetical protein HHL09_09110 [Luteolibacter luteus]
MKLPLLPLFLALQGPLLAAEQIVTLGDSLTFAYEGEFGFKKNVLGTVYGDGMPNTVRNWIETLSSTNYRNAYFDQGARKNLTLQFGLGSIFFRNEYNWAIPGLKVDAMRRFVLGEATFTELLAESDDFEAVVTALDFSNFSDATHFNHAEMVNQITSSAERLVFFIGGNDVRGIYGTVYNGGSAGTFADDFINDADAILDRIRTLNPNIPIVVVAVPHIGITPDIKSTSPTDPVKTPRVTALLADLNARLKTVADEHGAGFADIFTPTLPLLGSGSYGIHGIPFNNSGSKTGDLNYIWLNGQLSANFHPNTNMQLEIANIIVRAFNNRYGSEVAPLSATEMLVTALQKTSTQANMNFASWMTGFGLTGGLENSDADGDGIPAGVEFATGLNPNIQDADLIRTSLVSGGSQLQLAYPKRLPSSAFFTLQAASSTSLVPPFTPVASTAGADGLNRATIPSGGGRGFLRLEATVAP